MQQTPIWHNCQSVLLLSFNENIQYIREVGIEVSKKQQENAKFFQETLISPANSSLSKGPLRHVWLVFLCHLQTFAERLSITLRNQDDPRGRELSKVTAQRFRNILFLTRQPASHSARDVCSLVLV